MVVIGILQEIQTKLSFSIFGFLFKTTACSENYLYNKHIRGMFTSKLAAPVVQNRLGNSKLFKMNHLKSC